MSGSCIVEKTGVPRENHLPSVGAPSTH